MKKVLLSAIAMAALTLPVTPTAQAYTIDEILAGGNTAQEILTTSLNLGCYPDLGYTTTFEKVSDTKVRLKNFGNFGTDFILTLCNNNLVESKNGTKLKIDYQSPTNSSRTLLPGLLQGFFSNGYAGYNFNDEPSWHLTIGKTEEGLFYLTSDNVVAYRIGRNDPVDARIFHKVEYVFYQPNCVASHTRTTYRPRTNYIGEINGVIKGTPYMEDFQARVEFNEAEGTFKIMNFTNYGMAEDRNHARRCITGTINPEDHTLKFDENQDALSLLYIDPNPYIYYGYWYEFQLPYILKSCDPNIDYSTGSNAGYFSPELTGTYFLAKIAHNDAPHAWVTNDGQRRTYSGFKLTVNEAYTYAYQDDLIYNADPGIVPDNLNWHDLYSEAVYDGSVDETVDVELKLNKVGADASQIGVWGEIETKANHQNVDHYELHVVPGKFNSINNANFTHDLDLGHVSAQSIHEYNKDSHKPVNGGVAYAADASENVRVNDYSFGKLVPYADLGAGFTPNSKAYTFFIKTVYKPETGLTPTFHSMQYVEDGLVTGIDDVEMDLEDAEAPVEYYNMMGVRVMEPVEGEIYIRRQGTKAEKVRM